MKMILKAFIYFIALAGVTSACLFKQEKDSDFDRSKWFEEPDSRYNMADIIIGSQMLLGKDSNGVKEMLGEPLYRIQITNRWQYSMGTSQAGFGISIHSLSVRFDSSGVIGVDHIETKD